MSVCVNRARYFAAHGPWGRMVARQPRAGAPAPVQRVAYSRGPGRRSHADLGRDARSHRRREAAGARRVAAPHGRHSAGLLVAEPARDRPRAARVAAGVRLRPVPGRGFLPLGAGRFCRRRLRRSVRRRFAERGHAAISRRYSGAGRLDCRDSTAAAGGASLDAPRLHGRNVAVDSTQLDPVDRTRTSCAPCRPTLRC